MTNRRHFLRSAGALLALPGLESFGAVKTPKPPTRLAYLYFPNGSADGSWKPDRVGPNNSLQKLNPWMAPLEGFKKDLTITRKLWTPRGNGHAAGTATWLTGGSYNGRKNDAGGVSVDQIAAQHFAKDSPLPSLEISTEGEGYFSGSLPRNCLSWTSRDVPAIRETRPRAIFDKLFRRANEGFLDKSVIDLVLEQAKSLKRRASVADQRKIEEYLDSVRSIEKRLEFAESKTNHIAADKALTDTLARPKPGIPAIHEDYIQQLLELTALAFWSNATRVSTIMLDHGQSNRYFNFVPGVKGTWHALSHWKDSSGKTEDDDGVTSWKNPTTKKDQYNAVTRWHHEQFAYFLKRLTDLKNADGSSVLDSSMLVYGSSLADGHEHAERDLPIIVAGRANGALHPGHYFKPSRDTSFSRLHLTALQALGVPATSFAETNSPLAGI